jgi:hypothetical protein
MGIGTWGQVPCPRENEKTGREFINFLPVFLFLEGYAFKDPFFYSKVFTFGFH